jgi:hypothetical protein
VSTLDSKQTAQDDDVHTSNRAVVIHDKFVHDIVPVHPRPPIECLE